MKVSFHINQALRYRKLLFSICIMFYVLKINAATQAIYYVDPVMGINTNNGMSVQNPFRSIDKARNVIRLINSNMTGDIYVYLRGGLYTLTSTLAFDETDSGTNGYKIIYQAFPSEVPIISSGKKLTNWTLFDPIKNIYKSNIGSSIQSRQLFVGDKRADRAKSSVQLSNLTVDSVGHTTTDLSILNWTNPSDADFIYKISWTTPRCGVSTITQNGSKAVITMKQPGWFYCRNKGMTSVGSPSFTTTNAPWYIENVYEYLDSEGEWYLDRTGNVGGGASFANTVYYKPFAGEDITKAEVYMPTLEQLITVQGSTVDKPAHDIHFQGIMFQYATWNYPSSNDGFADAQNAVIRNNGRGDRIMSGGALFFKYALNNIVERCTFTHLGGLGIGMFAGCQNNLIQGCAFRDISANAIQIGDYYAWNQDGTENSMQQTNAKLLLTNNDVKNNYIDKCAVEYMSGHAIGVNYPQDMSIEHNEIGNMTSGAIHLGWGWTTYPTTVMRNNSIKTNYIHNILTEMDDSGGVYVLGSQDSSGSTYKSVVDSNYICSTGDNGLYFDNGASWYKANNNIVDDANVNINISTADKYNIIVTNTYSNKNQFWNKGTNCYVQTPFVTTDDNWPQTAKEIMNLAGLQPDYIDLRAKKVLYEHYNNFSKGNAPSGWITDLLGGTVTTEEIIANTGDRSICLNKSNPASTLSATKNFDAVSGIITVNCRIRTEATTDWKVMPHVIDRNGVIAASLIMKDGNLQLYKGSGSYRMIQAFLASQWYNVKLVLNTETQLLDVYVDNVLKISQDTFRNKLTEVARLQYSIGANYGGIAYFDNVSVLADQNALNTNFNKAILGKVPLGWTATSTQVYVDSIAGDTDRNLKITGSSTCSSVFNPVFNMVCVTAKVKVSQLSGTKTICQIFDRKNIKAFELKMNNGVIQAMNGTSWSNLKSYKSDIWYSLKVVANVSADKYDVYVNDTILLTQAAFLTQVADISKIAFVNDNSGVLTIDDVQVYNQGQLSKITTTAVVPATDELSFSVNLLSNPVSSGNNIRFKLINPGKKVIRFTLINLSGSVLANFNADNEGIYEFKKNNLISGIYFIKIHGKNEQSTIKVLVC